MTLEIYKKLPSEEIKAGNLCESATRALNHAIEAADKDNVLLLLSGGSSLALLDGIDMSLFGSKTIIAPLDERFSEKEDENNMAQITATEFYKKAKGVGATFIDTRIVEGESREHLSQRLNDSLAKWIEDNPTGKIIATVGIGPDGHVSGIMPCPEDKKGFEANFNDGNDRRLVVGYDAGNKNPFPQRVTTTMNLLRKIDTAIVYAVGENKREAVGKVLAADGDLATTPARILREMKGKVLLFTDAS